MPMPKRPRSHQLEEKSLAAFKCRLPDNWLTREKSKDYGVDLEVEIFDSDDNATGLLFYAQIKATDNSNERNQMQLKNSQREYLRSLDIKSILIRYCASDDSILWKWHDRVVENERNTNIQTVQFNHTDSWTEFTPNEIESALRDWRMVKDHPHGAPVHLQLDLADLPASRRQNFASMIRAIERETNAVTLSPNCGNLALTIKAFSDSVRVAVGVIASLEADLEASDQELSLVTLRYMLVAALSRLKLNQQADVLARRCLTLGKACASAELAWHACTALTSNAQQFVQFALLNEIHLNDPLGPVLVMATLSKVPFDPEDLFLAKEQFLKATLVSQASVNDTSKGAIYYSLGNLYANIHDNLKAFTSYNTARKLRPSYLNSVYFLSEMAGCLFGEGHFKPSAAIYKGAANAEAPSPRLLLHLGDSLLFSGLFEEAVTRFEDAAETDDVRVSTEACLKGDVSRWLIEKYGKETERQCSIVSTLDRPEGDVDVDRHILGSLDPLDDIANWNVAIKLTHEDKYRDALPHFLVCAFRKSGDQEAWTNALLCTLNMFDPAMMQAVLKCTLVLGGPTMADGFCDRLSMDETLAEHITDVVAEFCKELEVDNEPSKIIRILGNDSD